MAARSRPGRVAAALLLGLGALTAATGMAVASSGAAVRPAGWSQVGTLSGPVTVIAAVGRRDAWLAGIAEDTNDNKVFVRRWNGATWRSVRTPRAMFTDGAAIIGASSAANAWVFTLTRPAAASSYAVGWHWIAHSWRSYRLASGSSIDATAVISRTDAWAFGSVGAGKPYIIRYDGRTWRQVHAPLQPTTASKLNTHNIWIAGPTSARHKAFPFEAADWTGSGWRVLKLPRVRIPKGMYGERPQILAAGPSDVWMDFRLLSKKASGPDTLTLLHYNAGQWTQMSVPHGNLFAYSSLASDGRGGVWLALTDHQRFGSVVYDYRHGRWSNGTVLARQGNYTVIWAIARVPGTAVAWAGGYGGRTTGSSPSHGVLYEHRG